MEMNSDEVESVITAVREQGAKGLLPDMSEFMSNRDRGKALMDAVMYRRLEHKDFSIVISLFSRDKRPDKSHSVSYLYLFRLAMLNNDTGTATPAAGKIVTTLIPDVLDIDPSGIPEVNKDYEKLTNSAYVKVLSMLNDDEMIEAYISLQVLFASNGNQTVAALLASRRPEDLDFAYNHSEDEGISFAVIRMLEKTTFGPKSKRAKEMFRAIYARTGYDELEPEDFRHALKSLAKRRGFKAVDIAELIKGTNPAEYKRRVSGNRRDIAFIRDIHQRWQQQGIKTKQDAQGFIAEIRAANWGDQHSKEFQARVLQNLEIRYAHWMKDTED